MHPSLVFAGERLKARLEEEGFSVQPVNIRSSAFAMGFFWIVVLHWPCKKRIMVKRQAAIVRMWTKRIGVAYHQTPLCEGPTLVAGGALAMYCGFETSFCHQAEERGRAMGIPPWKACQEDPTLIRMARLASSPQFR